MSVELVMQLKEVLDRMLLPLISTVPNDLAVDAARQGDRRLFESTGGPLRWRVPDTSIEIVEMVEGDQQGGFLFSARTVRRLPVYYQDVKTLPYRSDGIYGHTGINLDYPHPGVSKGFYEGYVSTPGYLVPQAHFLGRFVDRLPQWMHTRYADETVWQWLALVLTILAVAIAGYAIKRFELYTAILTWRLNYVVV